MHQKNLIRLLVLLLIFIPCFTPIVTGDGGAFIYTTSLEQWIVLSQEKQIGIINYEDGYEKLIIVIDVKNSSLNGEKAVWIFPIPANPDEVTIDVINNIPNLDGYDIRYSARQGIFFCVK